MANEPIQGLPYPDLTGVPPNVPADIKALADAVAPRSVMRFASIAARDAALPAPVDGMVCYIAADNGYYVRAGGQWVVLWSDTGWVALATSSGDSTGLAVRRIGSQVHLQGEVWGVTAGATLFTLASQFRPSVRKAYFAVRAGGGTSALAGDARVYIQTSGEVRLHNFNTMPSSSPGIDISQTWLV